MLGKKRDVPLLEALPQKLVVAPQHNHEVHPALRPRIARVPVEDEPAARLVVVGDLFRVLARAGVDVERLRRTGTRQRLQVVNQLVLIHLVRLPVRVVGLVEALLLHQGAYVHVPHDMRAARTGKHLADLGRQRGLAGARRTGHHNIGVSSVRVTPRHLRSDHGTRCAVLLSTRNSCTGK